MDEYMVVLPEAHPLCVKEKIEIENLENEPCHAVRARWKNGVHPQK